MKILSLALLLTASLTFVLLGCTDNSNSLVSPNEQTIVPSSSATGLAKGSPVVHSATGSAHTILGSGPVGAATWFFTFTARQYTDGSFNGRVKINDHSTNAVGNFPVVYLNVEENRALIVDLGTLPIEFGGGTWYMAYVVIDNGEGSKSPADQHSWGIMLEENDPNVARLLSATPSEFFAMATELFGGTEEEWTLTNDMGNVQVR